jgi:hypothetical protein
VCVPSSRLCPSARAAASPWATPRRDMSAAAWGRGYP